LNEAKVNLENAKDSIKDRIKEFSEIREYLSNELLTDEFNKLDAIKYRLEGLKEMIEETEEIILDLQDP
jgi:predicted nucleotide-binding protein (sugar kinase/HSP70/actin superfamily)